tara:strand:- start:351 stop:1022 length:672 start_codon:yes stop_codon:yes gene_type:complete
MGGFANNAPIVTDGLVFYVDAGNSSSYPGSGTTWSDLIGSDDATLTNGPTYSSSNGGYIDYDGTNDYVVTSGGDLPALNSLSALSVCGFFKMDDFSAVRQIYSWGDNSGIRFRVDSGGTAVRFLERGGTNNNAYSITLSADTWYFFCTIADSSGLSAFIDSTKLTGGSAFAPTHTGNTVYIGSRSTSTSEIIKGSIACLSIYNKALTDAEVTQNYNALKNRFV